MRKLFLAPFGARDAGERLLKAALDTGVAPADILYLCPSPRRIDQAKVDFLRLSGRDAIVPPRWPRARWCCWGVCCARAPRPSDYIHSEGEDDHRQGETAWSFAPEVGLQLGAQLAISRRLLKTLVVKPRNMLRNLDRGGGVVLSEAVMMALAGKIGRDRAHALILEISREALAGQIPFRQAVAAHPEVRRLLTPRRLEAALDYRNSLGLAGHFVDEVLAAHRASTRRRRS